MVSAQLVCLYDFVMLQLALLFAFLIGGYLTAKLTPIHTNREHVSRKLTRWVIWIALPSVVLQKIHALQGFSLRSPEIFMPASQPWLHFALGFSVITLLVKPLGLSRPTWAALIMTVGFGNTSFVGLPLLRALLGPDSLATAVVLDQLGSFLILAMLGIPFVLAVSGDRASVSVRSLILRPLRFPAFVSLIAAVLLQPWRFPEWLESALTLLAMTLAPVALFSVGFGIKFRALSHQNIRLPLMVGLFLKLVVLPPVYFVLYSRVGASYPDLSPLIIKTIILEGCMAPMITSGLVAADHGLNPDLARLMVALGIPLSLITVPLWALLV